MASVLLMTSSTLATSNGFDLKAEQYMIFSPIKYIVRLLFSKIIDNIPDFNENTTWELRWIYCSILIWICAGLLNWAWNSSSKIFICGMFGAEISQIFSLVENEDIGSLQKSKHKNNSHSDTPVGYQN